MTRGQELVADAVPEWRPGDNAELDGIAMEADAMLAARLDTEIVRWIVGRRLNGEK